MPGYSPNSPNQTFLLYGIRSIIHKEEYLLSDKILNDVLCFTETWLRDENCWHSHSLTHKYLRNNHSDMDGGGLMMLVCNIYVVTTTYTLNNHELKCY